MALILNVPKFLEAQFTWTPIEVNGTTLNDSQVEYQIGYQTTELRDDPNYIQFYINWTRLITTGLIPMGALIYFNFGIFRGIQVIYKSRKKKSPKLNEELRSSKKMQIIPQTKCRSFLKRLTSVCIVEN